jgi:hypothetical protein
MFAGAETVFAVPGTMFAGDVHRVRWRRKCVRREGTLVRWHGNQVRRGWNLVREHREVCSRASAAC